MLSVPSEAVSIAQTRIAHGLNLSRGGKRNQPAISWPTTHNNPAYLLGQSRLYCRPACATGAEPSFIAQGQRQIRGTRSLRDFAHQAHVRTPISRDQTVVDHIMPQVAEQIRSMIT